MAKSDHLRFPAPAFGGKSKVASLIWERIGDVDNAIEPFAYSAAWLLERPHQARVETLNDLNPYVANFWRATNSPSLQGDLAEHMVAYYADWPVNETDLHSRHRWLVCSEEAAEFRRRMLEEPDYFDAKIAGWWIWGSCAWIGSGWCESPKTNCKQMPKIGDPGSGIYGQSCKRPRAHRSSNGNGPGSLPGLLANGRRQVLSQNGHGILVGSAPGQCGERLAWLCEWFNALRNRMRTVRVCCGNWLRVCDSDSVTIRLGTTGIMLDPPYAINLERMHQWIAHLRGDGSEPPTKKTGKNRNSQIYANDKTQDVDRLVAEVHLYCAMRGAILGYRIALCGYEGEHDALIELGWDVQSWESGGGYAIRNSTNANRKRERIWFSPHCLKPGLFT